MKHLVEQLKEQGVIKARSVAEAFLRCDRKDFVPEVMRELAYEDAPLPMGGGQTISQPYTVAFMLELLDVRPGQRVLDVGFGSGWTTCLLAELVGKEGKVFGLEIVPELFEFGRSNINKFNFENAKLDLHSGWDGWSEHAPYDRILVSAAVEEVPEKLKEQLKVSGRLVIPVGSPVLFSQSVKLIERVGGDEFRESDYPGFAFVPLV